MWPWSLYIYTSESEVCACERRQSAANVRAGQCAVKYQIKGFTASAKDAVIWRLARDRECKLMIAIKLKWTSLLISSDTCKSFTSVVDQRRPALASEAADCKEVLL